MASTSSANNEDPLIFTNYESTLYQCFSEMFQNKEFTDAILICENQRIHVHKFFLSASSSFFNNMFKQPKNRHQLAIKNVKYGDLLNVLAYIYKGQVALHPDSVTAFLDATNKLSVPISCDDKQKLSVNYGQSFDQSEHNDCQSNCDEGDKDCDETNVNTDESIYTETIHINKHNLYDESPKPRLPEDRPVKSQISNEKHEKPQIPGIVEVSREEFFKRMFKAQSLPWPGYNAIPMQTSPEPVQPLHSERMPSPQPSTSSDINMIAEIKKRKVNIGALRHRIKKLKRNGISEHKIERDEKKLMQLEQNLAEIIQKMELKHELK